MRPIGVVRNKFNLDNIPEDWNDIVSEVHIYSRYKRGLFRLNQFKTIIVVFWFHRSTKTQLQVHPRGDLKRPVRGVFATRSQMRPNKLAVSEVELISIKGTVLKVRGLDAINGTPVIDIKSGEYL